VFVLAIALIWYFDLFKYISIDRISDLSDWINGFGLLAPIVFISLYVIATVLFLPGSPLTLLAGIIFGPIFGTIYVSIASTLGALLAFLTAKYMGREFIENKLGENDLFKKIDDGVKAQGWKMIAITRLVPIFPFNAQNYIYGLTNINVVTYTFVSWICMLPATFAYVFLGGSILAGDGDVVKTVTYVGIAIAIIVLLSMVSKLITQKNEIN
jgi:uncharacterized membrane protein YdjX (TVP38/TMEM64 family)